MALTREQMDAKIAEHFGFEAKDDVEGVLATLSPDVEHDIVGWPSGPTRGREAAAAFYKIMFADFAESSVENLRRYYGDDFLVDETLWRGKAPGKPFGLDGRNRALEFRLLHVLEFAENGDIKREQAWLDMASIFRQLQD
ncbi:MAG: ester cyclase [Amphiplicatus sp.]